MALAPRERPQGDAEAKPVLPAAANPTASAATTASATSQRRQPQPPPAPQLRSRPSPARHAKHRLGAQQACRSSPRSGVRHARPGSRFQDQLLLDFHTTAIPGYLAPSPSPTPCWLTPTLPSNLAMVRNIVNFHLTAAPGRLVVSCVASGVFRVQVACLSVANVLLVRGRLNLGSRVLLVHSSVELAMDAARALAGRQHDDRLVNAVTAPCSNGSKTHLEQRSDMCTAAVPPKSAPVMPGHPQGSTFGMAVSSNPDILNAPHSHVAPQHADLPCSGQLSPTMVTTALNTPQPPAVRESYLQALLKPSQPPQTPPRYTKPILTTQGCFRCLASDHHVRDCRDPVRCRNYRRSGHCSHRCTMPMARTLTPHPRLPTVPVPASHAEVQAVPFSLRSTSPPSASTPPPPPTPASVFVPAAFDPLNMIASSSTAAPLDFELPRLPSPVATLAAGTRARRAPTPPGLLSSRLTTGAGAQPPLLAGPTRRGTRPHDGPPPRRSRRPRRSGRQQPTLLPTLLLMDPATTSTRSWRARRWTAGTSPRTRSTR